VTRRAAGKGFELRFLGGLTVEETAKGRGVSAANAKRDWNTAKA